MAEEPAPLPEPERPTPADEDDEALAPREAGVRRVAVAADGVAFATGVTSTVALAADVGVLDAVVPAALALVEADERRRGAGVAMESKEGVRTESGRGSAIRPVSSGR